MKERDIEAYLIARVKELGGETRKVKWIGRNSAPDRLVMLPEYRQPLTAEMVRAYSATHDCAMMEAKTHLQKGGYRPAQTAWVELKNPDTILSFPANAHERAQAREHERMRALGQRVEVIGTKEQVDRLLA